MKTPFARIRLGAIALLVIFATAVCSFRLIGGYSWLESTWLVVITISTVGFNERSAATPPVQLITIGLILVGVTAAAYTCGGFIQLLLEGEVDRVLGVKRMNKEISKTSQHVIICGFGRLGTDLAEQLQYRSQEFVVVDIDSDAVNHAVEQNWLFVHGDATAEAVLEQAGLMQARAIVTALPSDAENVFIALTARDLRPDIQIVAKAEHESSCRKLRQAGADKIVMPHRVGAQQMERMISRPTTADLVELFAEASHLEMELDEFRIGPHSPLAGKPLSKSRIKEDFNLLIVGLKNPAGEFQFNPKPTQVLEADDTVLVIGNVNDINRMKNAQL